MSGPAASGTELRDRFGPPRDQGSRPTCLAFAASDLHAALRFGWEPLSCETLFFHAQRRAGRTPNEGATLSFVLEAVAQDGQPVEAGWPYRSTTPTPSDWTPPAFDGPIFLRRGETTPASWPRIVESLDQGRPALILTTLSASFFTPDADGVVRAPAAERPDPALRHALVAVGHGVIDHQPALLVRNSWGAGWGRDGNAWLPADYLAARLFAMALFDEDDHVPARSLAA